MNTFKKIDSYFERVFRKIDSCFFEKIFGEIEYIPDKVEARFGLKWRRIYEIVVVAIVDLVIAHAVLLVALLVTYWCYGHYNFIAFVAFFGGLLQYYFLVKSSCRIILSHHNETGLTS